MRFSLPPTIQAALDELLLTLDQALGENLHAVVLHGSAARGDYVAGESDVDLVVVLGNAPIDVLEEIGAGLQLARYKARIEAILLLEKETNRVADVFPLMIQDIAEAGIALRGVNPFVGVATKPEHVRLRVEQELRNTQLRLRRATAEARGDIAILQQVVRRKSRQLRSSLRAALGLFGEEAPARLEDLYEALGKRHSLSGLPVTGELPDPRASAAALASLLTLVLEEVDALEVS